VDGDQGIGDHLHRDGGTHASQMEVMRGDRLQGSPRFQCNK
jgi:hypothetical protein